MSFERIRDFRRRLERDAAQRVVETTHGIACLSPSIPNVYDHNFLSVETATAPAEVLATEADAVMEEHRHRRVIVQDGSPGLAESFAALGYALQTHLVLEHGRSPDRRADTSMVREVPFEDLEAPRSRSVLGEPWGGEEIARELNRAKRDIAAAVPTTYFGAFVADTLAGWCELRVRDGVAQIEDVEVLEEFRGRGLGRAVVQHAVEAGLAAAEVVFLEAFADDWPRELYAKLGFVAVGRRDFYTRLPHPVTRVRLRTPRLELRAATVAEVRQLFRVAEAGVHDPAIMPFEIPWTDKLDEEDFVAHLSDNDSTKLRLVAFLDGEPIGVQAVDLRGDGAVTGSWLGLAFQGRGLGTEMRAAALTLAFDHLGAAVARSGAVQGNAQSMRVSEKLGYAVVGSHTISPRGEPVEHTDLELRKEDFVSPVPVEVSGTQGVA